MIILKLIIGLVSLADFLAGITIAFAMMPFSLLAEALTNNAREIAII